MIHKDTFKFLHNLGENNNRVWFQEHKSEFDKIKRDFEEFVDSLIARISDFDHSISHLQAKKCIYRINRDTRFSRDKSPYKINLGAYLNAVSKRSDIHSSAGYYVHLQEGNSFIGGGAYLPESSWLYDIRKKIAENPKKFTDLIEDKGFKKYYTFYGDKLVRPPAGFPKDHQAIELLKHKSFLATYTLQDKEVFQDKFLDLTVGAFKELKAFNDFLNNV